jgi:putative transposase
LSTNEVGGSIGSMAGRYRRTPHTVYEIKYHFVFVPKYRFCVLEGKIKSWLEETISQICESMEILMVEGNVSSDHVHMCLSVPPKYAPADVMKQIKGKTSEMVFREFPELTKRYWGQHFWARGYFVSTVGINEETIRRYIKNQREDDTAEKQIKLWK